MEIEFTEEDEIKARELYEARLVRCVPVAKKVFTILHSHMGDVTMGENDDVQKSIGPVAKEILQMFLDEDVRWADKGFVMNLMLQVIGSLNDTLKQSFDISWDKAVGKKFGKDALDLTFREVDEILKS